MKFVLQLVFLFSSLVVSQSDERGWYDKPFLRYDSSEGKLDGGAKEIIGTELRKENLATEAFNHRYVELGSGGSISWTIKKAINAFNIRFSLPDAPDGFGTTANLLVSKNGRTVNTIVLDSHFAYSYMTQDFDPTDSKPGPGLYPLMRFDEWHQLLAETFEEGDVLTLAYGSGETISLDFVELEFVAGPLPPPPGATDITSFGVIEGMFENAPQDNMGGFYNSMGSAPVYIPPGIWCLPYQFVVGTSGAQYYGAGIYYTTIFFTNPQQAGGGIISVGSDQVFAHFSLRSVNNKRRDGYAYMDYKGFSQSFGGKSVLEDLWIQHFEAGIWAGGYGGPAPDGLIVRNCRLRDNYADGINLAEGSSNSVIEFSDSRNNGDDGMASWSSGPCNHNNTIRYCDIEFIWRAGGIGFFGGGGHQVHNVYVGQNYGSAGVRLTADFPGCAFVAGEPIHIFNVTIKGAGSRFDLWSASLGAIQIQGTNYAIPGPIFEDIDIIDAQFDGIHIIDDTLTGAIFRNITIHSVGADGLTGADVGESRPGCGINNKGASGDATFEGIKYGEGVNEQC